MDDSILSDNDLDEIDDQYYEQLEERLLQEMAKASGTKMTVTGKGVFQIDRLKRQRKQKDLEN